MSNFTIVDYRLLRFGKFRITIFSIPDFLDPIVLGSMSELRF